MMLAPFAPELQRLQQAATAARTQLDTFGASLVPMLGFGPGNVYEGLHVSRVYFDAQCYQRGRDWLPGFRVIGTRNGNWDSLVLDINGNKVTFG